MTDRDRRAARRRRTAGLRRLADHGRGVAARAAAPGGDHGRAGRPGAPASPACSTTCWPGDSAPAGSSRSTRRSLDTIVRRAISLIFAAAPGAVVDAFTWLSLGSNGRREAVLSSDVDSAVAFDDCVARGEIPATGRFRRGRRRAGRAGLSGDEHGATAPHPAFSRTNAQWRAAAEQWLAAPAQEPGRDDDVAAGRRPADPRRPRACPRSPRCSATCGGTAARCGCCCRSRCRTRARMRSVRDVLHRRAGDLRHQDPRGAADRQPGALGGAQRRLRGAADHRTAAGGVGSAMLPSDAGGEPDRGVRGPPAAAAALPAAAAVTSGERPSDLLTLGPAVADRPQHGRPGRPRDRRRPAPDGQRRALRAGRGLGRGRPPLSRTVAG